jgi:hypothetical protein
MRMIYTQYIGDSDGRVQPGVQTGVHQLDEVISTSPRLQTGDSAFDSNPQFPEQRVSHTFEVCFYLKVSSPFVGGDLAQL